MPEADACMTYRTSRVLWSKKNSVVCLVFFSAVSMLSLPMAGKEEWSQSLPLFFYNSIEH